MIMDQAARIRAADDVFDPDRSDLEVYAAIAAELGARRVLDVGCGTGAFALLLAARGIEVAGVEPDGGALTVARGRPGADRVRWLHGDATSLPPMAVDLATMTANVAQAITDDSDWSGTLRGIHAALRPDGHLVFETRDPARRAWEAWTRETTYGTAELDGVGEVAGWVEVTGVDWPVVHLRGTYVFPGEDPVSSDESLRFRERDEVTADLTAHGYAVEEVRDAPDRPGREFVFLARRG